MGDPICKWRVASPKTVVELVSWLPKEKMPEDDFRNIIDTRCHGFMHTPYQLACQLGLYAIIDGIYYPLFDKDITDSEANRYLEYAITKYYVPNPYTARGFKNLEHPIVLESSIVEFLELHPGQHSLHHILQYLLKEDVGNFPATKTFLSYSKLFTIEGNDVTLNPNYKEIMEAQFNRYDKKGFFSTFSSPLSIRKNDGPLQIIYYGAPGTGKSHKVNKLIDEDKNNYQRVTFHPDTDYSSFVGCYKPKKEDGKLTYAFGAQSFLTAYIEAWKLCAQSFNSETQETPAPYYLLIEEINRGNCAQIFGDIFQLLDRDEYGFSKYSITPDTEITNHLQTAFADLQLPDKFAKIASGEMMRLPNNFYIYATMNTSDQSLFPIDSAFKRRWDWEYTPITDGGKGYAIKLNDGTRYDWYDFIRRINERIFKATHSEDKQMGYWFIHLPEGQTFISQDTFISKVLFYLWSDIYKDYGKESIFQGEDAEGKKSPLPFHTFFEGDVTQKIHDFMRYNGINPIKDNTESENETLEETSEDNTSIVANVNDKEVKGLRGIVKETLKQYLSTHNSSVDVICKEWNETFANIPQGRGDNLFLITDEELETLAEQKASTDAKYKNRYCHVENLNVWGGWTKDTITSFIDKVNQSHFGITIEIL